MSKQSLHQKNAENIDRRIKSSFMTDAKEVHPTNTSHCYNVVATLWQCCDNVASQNIATRLWVVVAMLFFGGFFVIKL